MIKIGSFDVVVNNKLNYRKKSVNDIMWIAAENGWGGAQSMEESDKYDLFRWFIRAVWVKNGRGICNNW
jgi:hypothetical protein